MKTFLSAALCIAVIGVSSINAGTANLPAVGLVTTAGTPANGTNEIQTITFGSGITAGTFKLTYGPRTTAAIAWSATNGTLVTNIDTALEALSNVGSAGVTTAVGTMTAGIGTITVTFTGRNAKQDVPAMTVATQPTGGTVSVATTTPGVTADGRNAPPGTLCFDTTNVKLYYNAGAPPSPTWTQCPTTLLGP